MKIKGAVAAGHEETAQAAVTILEEGGNAFDAVIAAHLVACVAEPVLASLGGGSFLTSYSPKNGPLVYDFFVQTPKCSKPLSEIEFFPVSVDFGTTQQEFHVGMGAVGTPGVVRGIFAIHRDLCTMPMNRLIEPAVELAKSGVRINAFQAYIFDLVQAIYSFNNETRAVFQDPVSKKGMLKEGGVFRLPEFADFLDSLAQEGEDLFYRGEVSQRISDLCAQSGGYLQRQDLENYQVPKRNPLSLDYHGCKLFTNPPPSSGGLLIAFALNLLEQCEPTRYKLGSANYLQLLSKVLGLTEKARLDLNLLESESCPIQTLLNPDYIRLYQQQILSQPACSRGTTHISVTDNQGNLASLTTSNGEGCGHFIPGTGIMLNNMLGEEDLNPAGFNVWPKDTRMTSMMAPTLVFFPGGKKVALGSGGSNRLRTAILQVLINLIDFKLPLDEAVGNPRIHFEAGLLSVEFGFDEKEMNSLLRNYPDHKLWDSLNLFFGGAHAVSFQDGNFEGVGDPRRGGSSLIV